MSPDLERRLREAESVLGTPSPSVTRQAREVAVAAAAAGRRQRARGVGIAGAMLAAVALGVGIGSLTLTGSGEASKTQGLGFLPADGWTVLQAGTPAISSRPGTALAANVPLHRRDTADGFPYSTLQALPEDGVVLIASFFRVSDAQKSTDRLPLRLGDAVPYIRFGGQARPERPLGQYELRAVVEGYAVEVHAYFGTPGPSAALLAEAQRQLDRLVVSPGEPDGAAPRAPVRSDTVTIAYQRFWYPPGNYYALRFYGTIASAQAGDYITVMHKPCGGSFSTAIAGATTTAGGGWEAQPDRPPGPGEYRARWNDEISKPVTYKPPLVPWLEKVGPGKFRASVSSYTLPGGRQSMNGGRIDLQWLASGQWIRLRTANLKLWPAKSGSFGKFWQATFAVPTRGLTLRAFVPTKTALPCSAAGASKALRS